MGYCLNLIKNNKPARIEGKDIGRTLIQIVKSLKARTVPEFMQKIEAWRYKMTMRASGQNAQFKVDLINDQADTLKAVAEFAKGVSEIESKLYNLFQDSNDEGVKPAIVLSTVHKAKGLEWNNVYMLTDTFKTPANRQLTTEQQQEESNIYYVAVTRAKNTLSMVSV